MPRGAASDGIRERQIRHSLSVPSVYQESPLGSKKWVPNHPEGSSLAVRSGRQKTVSESHHKSPSGAWDGGGPFYTSRTEEVMNNVHLNLGPKTKSGNPATYAGPVGIPLPLAEKEAISARLGKLGSEDTSGLDPKGATAIALCQPQRSAGSLATTLAESVREGIPSLPGIHTWQRRTQLAKAAGGEYLNAVFGWLPLVDEVKNTSSNISHSAQIAKSYQGDAGKDVRRGFDFDTENETSGPIIVGTGKATVGGITNSAGAAWTFNGFDNPAVSGGNISRTVTVSRRAWFRGAFTFALPSNSDSFKGMLKYGSLADHVIGISPLTPTILWELTPWSWAIDWFSNTQQVIENVTSFGIYGLVMRYGYMMEETIEKVDYILDKSGLFGAEERAVGPISYITTTKVRRPANPFGFGVGWEGLSPTQLAITAALGITRL